MDPAGEIQKEKRNVNFQTCPCGSERCRSDRAFHGVGDANGRLQVIACLSCQSKRDPVIFNH